MGGVTDARREEAERLRDYFEVQLMFAGTLADRTSRPLSDVCREFTNLHRRLGLGREDGAPSSAWARYAAGLEQRPSTPDRLDWTVAFFVDCPPEEDATRRFGCFSFELLEAGEVVRIHFSNRDSADGSGPLTRAKSDRRRAELHEMFRYIRAHHPGARAVRGGSWLYNLEAYRRLFPQAYAASTFAPDRPLLGGTSTWGQVLDFRSAVRPDVREALLAGIRRVDVAEPWRAFPLRALRAEQPIGVFHAFYDCEPPAT